MRKSVIWCVALVLAATSGAYGSDYFWDCTTTGAWGTHINPGVWDDCANWAPGYNALPGAADNAWVMNGGTLRIPQVDGFNALNNVSVTYGQFVIANGSNMLYPYCIWTLNVVDDCGGTGDLIWRSTNSVATVYQSRTTFNIDGNVLLNNTTAFYYGSGGRDTFNLYGASKGFRNQSSDATSGGWVINVHGSYFDNGLKRGYTCGNTVNVKSGGQIITRPNNTASEWWAKYYNFEGGQSNLPALGDCVTFGYQPQKTDNGVNKGSLVIAGGVQYPNDVRIGSDYWGATKQKADATYVYRTKGGDFTVGRDLKINETAGTSAQDGLFLNFEENGTLAKINATILHDFLVDDSGRGTSGIEWFGFRGKDATIRVGRDLVLGADTTGYYAWAPRNATKVDLGNATIYVGRNLVIWRGDAVFQGFWNPGTSTIVCDGCGTTQNQILRTFSYVDSVPLNNLVINNPGGYVVLDNVLRGAAGVQVRPGGLLLKGNLEVYSRFNDSDLPIAFNGPEHLLKVGPGGSLAGGSFDNIILLTDAVLRLGSDVTMDNIDMQSGSKLYLNGFTLMVEDSTFISNLVSTDGVPYTDYGSNGMIYGTFVIPEPATMLLLGTGALGVLGYVRRRRMM